MTDRIGVDVKTIADLLANTSEAERGCREWQGHRDEDGYGRIGMIRTHRLIWELANSEIPPGMFVRHSCDNPPCINLEHLSLGTPAENSRDMVERGRQHCGKREHHGSARLTETDIAAIRAAWGAGSTPTNLAAAYSVTHQHISKIVRGLYWPA